jgi:DNA-binding transcriptional MerR regulator
VSEHLGSDAPDEHLLTVDELAAATGVTVRNTRYYAGLGLLPPPVRRGRVAYYGPRHVARLELVRALQDHGFTLSAIERYLTSLAATATPAELSVQRALLTAWRPSRRERFPACELAARAGRELSEEDVAWLTSVGALRRDGDDYLALPVLRLAVELLEIGMPPEGIQAADAAVRRHMAELADELTGILGDVLAGYDLATMSAEEAHELERALAALRALTLEAIVESFQHAAHQLAKRTLTASTLSDAANG